MRRNLLRRWLHSHEEDTAEGQVYRPAGYAFPRARGRAGFELRDDGRCEYIAIGRGDRPEVVTGEWTLDGDRIRMRLETGESTEMRVVSVDRERLVVRY